MESIFQDDDYTVVKSVRCVNTPSLPAVSWNRLTQNLKNALEHIPPKNQSGVLFGPEKVYRSNMPPTMTFDKPNVDVILKSANVTIEKYGESNIKRDIGSRVYVFPHDKKNENLFRIYKVKSSYASFYIEHTDTYTKSSIKAFFEDKTNSPKEHHLNNILVKLDSISNRGYNWDDNMSEAINMESLSYARTIIPEILESVINRYIWVEPYISSDEEGDITVRWSINSKRLYIVISEGEISYLKVFGKDLNPEMTEGRIVRNGYIEVKDEYNKLWEWLISE